MGGGRVGDDGGGTGGGWMLRVCEAGTRKERIGERGISMGKAMNEHGNRVTGYARAKGGESWIFSSLPSRARENGSSVVPSTRYSCSDSFRFVVRRSGVGWVEKGSGRGSWEGKGGERECVCVYVCGVQNRHAK